jgi:hypothetical protein
VSGRRRPRSAPPDPGSARRCAGGRIVRRPSADDIEKGRASLAELATAAGRDPDAIDVTVFGEDSDREAIQGFEASGADRVIVRLSSTGDETALTELERMAAKVFA